jgi:glycosyltransferase involved in cell wall biosynthesis
MKKILIYSEVDFFAGCENMPTIFLNHENLFDNISFSLLYRKNKNYSRGLKIRVKDKSKTDSINIWHFSLYKRSKFTKVIFYLASFLFAPIIFLQNLYMLTLYFKKFNPDLLYLNNGGYPGSFSVRVASTAAKILKIKTVMFVNNIATPYESLERFLNYPYDRLIGEHIDYFLTGSIEAGNSLNRVLGVSPKKCFTIFNAIDLNRFNKIEDRSLKDRDTIKFGIVGLHEKRKGHHILLKSINNLIKNHSKTHDKFSLLIEGNGKETNFLKKYVNDKNLGEYITFIGVLNNIEEFYNEIDVLVVPSVGFEDLPNVISEAFAFKIPVIGSNLAGIPEQIIDGKNGFLVDINDHISIANKFMYFIDNKFEINKMGRNAREVYESKFSVNAVALKYNKFFKNILDA